MPEELKGAAVFLKPDTVWEDDVLKAETFRSTDEGVAFWCTVDGHTLYHAGDLNHWYWDGEDPQWNENMTRNYREEIGKMKGRHADAALDCSWGYRERIVEISRQGQEFSI